MRAGSLLSWYYLLGNHDDPEGTRNWSKSSAYLKQMVKMAEKDKKLTRGSSHNSFLLFLLQQDALIKDFEYFKDDQKFYAKVK